MERYFECWKCGSYTTTKGDKPDFMCSAPMAARISGICGGSFTIELNKDDIREKEKKWNLEQNKERWK